MADVYEKDAALSEDIGFGLAPVPTDPLTVK